MTVGESVAELRKVRGWTQAELARRVGIHPAAVSHIESDRREPRLRMLDKVRRELGVTWSRLLCGTNYGDAPAPSPSERGCNGTGQRLSKPPPRIGDGTPLELIGGVTWEKCPGCDDCAAPSPSPSGELRARLKDAVDALTLHHFEAVVPTASIEAAIEVALAVPEVPPMSGAITSTGVWSDNTGGGAVTPSLYPSPAENVLMSLWWTLTHPPVRAAAPNSVKEIADRVAALGGMEGVIAALRAQRTAPPGGEKEE